MNKSQLIDAVSTEAGFPKDVVARILNGALDTIQTTLASGEEVVFTRFGTFKPVDKPAKSAFSALVGRVVDTPARTVPKFTPGSVFTETVNGGQKVKQVA